MYLNKTGNGIHIYRILFDEANVYSESDFFKHNNQDTNIIELKKEINTLRPCGYHKPIKVFLSHIQ